MLNSFQMSISTAFMLSATVGFWLVLQQRPLDVIAAPPLSVTLPVAAALAALMLYAEPVVNVAK